MTTPAYSDQTWSRRYGTENFTLTGSARSNSASSGILLFSRIEGFNSQAKSLKWNRANFSFRRQETGAEGVVFVATRTGTTWTVQASYDFSTEFAAVAAGGYREFNLDISSLLTDAQRTITLTGSENGFCWGLWGATSSGDANQIFCRLSGLTTGIDNNGIVKTLAHDGGLPSTWDDSDADGDNNDRWWILGNVDFEEDADRSPVFEASPYDGTGELNRVLPHDLTEGYTIALKDITTPAGTGKLEVYLRAANGGAATDVAYAAIDLDNDLVEFDTSDSSPAQVSFARTQSAAVTVDAWIVVKPGGLAAELLWQVRTDGYAEGPVSSSDFAPRAHASATAGEHNQSITLSERADHLTIPAAAGWTIGNLYIGRPIYVIGDSQAIAGPSSTTTQGTQRLSEYIASNLDYPQALLFIGQPGGRLLDGSTAHSAAYQRVMGDSPGEGSAISGMFNCDVFVAGIGVNDISADVDDTAASVTAFLRDYQSRMTQMTGAILSNDDSNAIWYLALPTWPGATYTDQDDAASRAGRFLIAQAVLNDQPAYDPYGWTAADPATRLPDNLHYDGTSASFVMGRLLTAVKSGLNDLHDNTAQTFKQDLYDKFAATSAITDLVAAANITQDYSPQNSSLPRIVYTKISGDSTQAMLGDVNCQRRTYQVDCVAGDPLTAEQIADAIRSTFHAFRGTLGTFDVMHTNAFEISDEVPDADDGSDDRLSTSRLELEFHYRT